MCYDLSPIPTHQFITLNTKNESNDGSPIPLDQLFTVTDKDTLDATQLFDFQQDDIGDPFDTNPELDKPNPQDHETNDELPNISVVPLIASPTTTNQQETDPSIMTQSGLLMQSKVV